MRWRGFYVLGRHMSASVKHVTFMRNTLRKYYQKINKGYSVSQIAHHYIEIIISTSVFYLSNHNYCFYFHDIDKTNRAGGGA